MAQAQARTLVSESRGAFSSVSLYQENPKTGQIEVRQQSDNRAVSTYQYSGQASVKLYYQKCLVTFRQVFLPYGYPDSVSSDYLQYQIWDTVQAFSSSITGALATEAVMKGVGVGDENASTLAATMTWLIKSGSGMIGQILFAWAKGTALDHDNKKWRLFADVLNDFATFVDLITPLFPTTIITLVFCCSSVARALVGVAGGGTRAAITQHQARRNNSADVSAKDGSQETFVNLMSLLVCLMLLPAVSGKVFLVWTLFGIFTFLHVYSNYRAVKALQLETFNTSRLLLCLRQYLKNGRVPSIRQVNADENVVIGFGVKDVDVCHVRIRLGVSIEEALTDKRDVNQSQQLSKLKLQNILDNSGGRSFLIIPKLESNEFSIVLHENISASDIIEAYVRAVFTAVAHNSIEGDTDDTIEELNGLSDDVTEDWEIFRNVVQAAGFNTSIALLSAGDWRAKWKHV